MDGAVGAANGANGYDSDQEYQNPECFLKDLLKPNHKETQQSKDIVLEYLAIFLKFCKGIENEDAKADLMRKLNQLIASTKQEVATLRHHRPVSKGQLTLQAPNFD